MTRARDRLYLSSAVKDGLLRPGTGSLAEVLPASLKPLFGVAAASKADHLDWSAGSGRTFTWRICHPPDSEMTIAPVASESALDASAAAVPMARVNGLRRVSVSDWLHRSDPDPPLEQSGRSDAAMIGILVHRLLQRFNRVTVEGADLRAAAAALIAPEERVMTSSLDRVISTAIELWEGVCKREEVAALLASSELLTEVPFSLKIEEEGLPVILRGTIDCLAIAADGSVSVVEFKTGGRREIHQRQLDLYLRAASMLFPARRVEGFLIHA
jgi:ATP-dependent exoDNAse (exonuclease V) beta subunit